MQLVEAWVTAQNADAVAAIANDEAVAGPARKAARRGLAVLKSRGVAIPERSHVARLAAAEPDTYEAWLLAPDASGTSVVSVAARASTGRYRLVEAVVRDRVGILQIHGGELSRTQLRSAFDDTERRLGYAPAPVPVDWARARIASARADNEKSGALLPMGIDSHRELLEPIPADVPAHPIDAAKVAPEGAVAERAARSATLHAEPEFRSWLPDGMALQELLLKIGEAIGTSGSDDPRQGRHGRRGADHGRDRPFLHPRGSRHRRRAHEGRRRLGARARRRRTRPRRARHRQRHRGRGAHHAAPQRRALPPGLLPEGARDARGTLRRAAAGPRPRSSGGRAGDAGG